MKIIIPLFTILLSSASICAQTQRYMNITAFGIMAGESSNENEAPLSIISEHHYFFSRNISAGLMTGIEQFKENTLPLGLNIKLYIPGLNSRAFFSVHGGYAVSLDKPNIQGIKKSRGGIMAGTEAGFLFNINEFSAVFVAVGYRYQELHYDLQDWWLDQYKRVYTYNRISVRVGIALY